LLRSAGRRIPSGKIARSNWTTLSPRDSTRVVAWGALQLVAEEVGSRLAPALPWLRALGRCAGRASCIETHFMPSILPSPAVCPVVDVGASREESWCCRRGCRGRKRECRWTTIAAIRSALHRVAENGNHFKAVHVTVRQPRLQTLKGIVLLRLHFTTAHLTSPRFASTGP
jgi:hypothetical protein